MYTNRKLQSAVRLALGLSVGSLALGASPGALAQDEGVDEIEEITVTGSRIKRADLDSASPVTVLSRAQIQMTGLTDVGNLIQRMPSMSGSPISTTTNNGGDGSVEIDLRGMGPDRTVTLINGHRTVDGGDYQTIPVMMIERVEILKDGASAIYGADAVAGVVNIITRKDFEGLEIQAQTADFFDMDSGVQSSIALIAGTTFDGGNFVFGAEYVDQEEAFQGDTPWDFMQNKFYIYPTAVGGCENHISLPFDGTPSGGCYPIGSTRIPEGYHTFITQGDFMNVDGSGLVPYDGRLYNFSPFNYIQTPYKRTNIFAEGNFDISENVRFSGEFRGNFRESLQELAPQPYDSRFDPAFAGVFGGVAYNGISEDNFYLVQAATAAGLAIEPVIVAQRRMHEATRGATQEVTQYQGVLKLQGTVNNIDWEIFYNRGHRLRTERDQGQFFGPNLSNAMGPSADLDGDGSPECYQDITDPASLIVGCVPMNFFGGPLSVTQDMFDYVSVGLSDSYLTNQHLWGISVTGSAFELPGGELGWAAGAGYWGQQFSLNKDSGKQLNAVTGNKGLSTDGSLYANSLFVEVLAPVYDNGTQAIALKGGARYDDYNIFGSDTTWQAGVEFQAIESLKLRATAGTVFRAPTIEDLFGGTVDSFPTYVDPCLNPPLPPGCDQVAIQTNTQLLAKVGGNPLLIPETGDTITAGLVWTPELGNSDLSITVDYWKTDLESGISALGVQFILDDCYVGNNPSSCALVTRRPNYEVEQVIDGNLNVAEQGAEGIDAEVRWSLDTGVGQFDFAMIWSHLLERTKTAFAGDAQQNLEGTYTNWTGEDGGAYAEDKINFSVQWFRNDLSIGYLAEYISSLDTSAAFADYNYVIDSQLYSDIVASYDFPQTGTKVTVGVTNVTDEEPPFIDVGFNASTDQATYRQFGMGYYFRLTQSF